MDTSQLIAVYPKATARLLLFDYDGTLADIAPTPPEAAPTLALLELLQGLASDPANTLVIISGRDRATLEQWLGHLPVHFTAEHGFWRRHAGESWEPTLPLDTSWQTEIAPLLRAAVLDCPGSFIEQKDSSLGWHYRTASNSDRAQRVAAKLLAEVQALADKAGVRVMNGDKILEVQLAGTSKGQAAQYWLQQGTYDCIIAGGDDTTDEDMLLALPPQAFTIHVGPGDSAARLRLDSASAMRQLLGQLLTAS